MYAYPPLLKLLKFWCSQRDFEFFIAVFYCKSYRDFYALSTVGVFIYNFKRIPRARDNECHITCKRGNQHAPSN